MRSSGILLAALAYVVVGLSTAALAGAAASSRGTTTWRLVAWALSVAIFACHTVISRRDGSTPVSSGAARVALAVALAAFAIAVLGPVRSHWHDAHLARVALLSLVAWPVLTGVPAFIVAWLGGYVLDRRSRSAHARPSPSL